MNLVSLTFVEILADHVLEQQMTCLSEKNLTKIRYQS